MHSWIKFSMKNAGVIFIAMLLVLAGGVYAKTQMKMEEMPNVDVPYVQVLVVYPGANPEQALENVGKPMEQALSGLKNVKKVYLSAGSNYVAATMEFSLDQPMDAAQKDINSALGSLKLPEGAQKPQVSIEGPTQAPVFSFGVTADADQASIQQYVTDRIKPALSGISGISSINIHGTSDKKLYIKVDPDKLKQQNLTLDKVKQMLLANNISIPAGQLTIDGKDLNVEAGRKISSVEEAQNIQLFTVDQDMSALSDSFRSFGEGFGTIGSSLGKIGQGMGNLTKGQMMLQAELQLLQGISGLSSKLAGEQTALESLNQQLASLEQGQMSEAETQTKTYLQAQIDNLNKTIAAESNQLQALQNQLASLQKQVDSSGRDTAGVLQSMAGGTGAKPSGNLSPQPALNIRALKLSNIADIYYGPGSDISLTRLNGKPAIVTDIKAQPGTNVVEMIKQINQKLAELKLPEGYALTKLRDSSVQVEKSVNNMQREAVLGALFAMLITFIFLRNWRSTLVAVLSIPLSIFASLITLYLLGYSLNIMTLAGIAVAVGRVVDDSIVVIENIYRRMRTSGSRSSQLVLEAAKEVGQAVISSTLTTIAVFAPLAFVPGIVGKFFAPFGVTVVVSILFSLIVAISVVPLLSSLFLMNIKHVEAKDNLLQRAYARVLDWCLDHKLAVVLIAAAMFAGSLAMVKNIPQNFLPAEKTVSYSYSVSLPVGTSAGKTDQVSDRVEEALRSRSDIKSYQTSIKGENLSMQIELKEGLSREDTKKFEQEMQRLSETLGSGTTSALTPLGIATGYGGLFLVLNGPDIKTLAEAGEIIVKAIKDVPGLADVKTNLSAVKPQLSVQVNPEAAAKNGLNPAMVAMSVRQMINGDSVMNVELNGRTTDVNLALKVDNLDNLDTLRNQLLTNATGGQVKLGDVAEVSVKPGPTSINRLNQQEYVSLTGRFTTDNSSAVQKEVENRVKGLKLPDGVSQYFEGESKAMSEGFRNLGLAMIVAVVLVYMVMLIAFGEMLAPLSILFSLPFIFIGGLGGLYFSGEALGVPALVGFLMLIGIVVTNAIVLVDRVIQNRNAQMTTRQALVEAGRTRLRPILMTAVATICALLPLAVSQEGGIISRSLAIVVISGLTTSTLLTLVIVPVAYQALDSLRIKIWGLQLPAGQQVETLAK